MASLLINIDVSDIKKATQFYVEAFGLTVGRIFGDHGVELLGLPVAVYLLEKQEGTRPFDGATFPRMFSRHWTPVHLDIVVDEIDAAILRATLAGANLEARVTTAPWGKIAMLSDPFGNGFCILEFVGRGYDEIATPSTLPGQS